MTTNENISTLKMITTPEQIHNHPSNNSPTKAQFSFPHAERFNISNKVNQCAVAYYEVKDSVYRNQRTTSLGKGQKYDFTRNGKDNPGPNAYYPTNLTIASENKKGPCFGVSREKMTNQGLSQILKTSKNIPGPGAYEPLLPKTQQTVSFHLKLENKKLGITNIGPGSYNINSTFEPNKPIFNSKHRSVKGVKFGQALQKENNIDEKDNNKVLPMVVDKTYQLNANGNYFNSKYPNSKCRSFGKATRDSKQKGIANPGPGQYRMPSEFGIYESNRAND